MIIRNKFALAAGIALSIVAVSQVFIVRGQSGPRLYTTWSQPGGSIEGAQYSALKQINKTNVHQLELQWFHPAPGPTGRFAFSPLVVDNVMYVVGKDSAVFALDAATGKEIWTYETEGTPTNRGFNYWESKDRSDRRIIFASRSYLQQLDARTGKPIASFGVQRSRQSARGPWAHASADRRRAVGIARTCVREPSRPRIGARRRIQLAARRHPRFRRADGQARLDVPHDSPSWRVRLRHVAARRVEDRGRRQHLGRVLGRREARHRIFSARTRRHSICGAAIEKGDNLFGNTLLALDLRTGKRLWHYQLLHHDLWDYDLVTGPKLLTVKQNGKPVDIVAQAHEVRTALCVRSRDGQADLADRRAPGAAERRAWRALVADAAVSHQAAAVLPAEVHRSRCESVP